MSTQPHSAGPRPVGIVAAYRAEIAPLLHLAPSMRRTVRGAIHLRLPLGEVVLAISGAGTSNARRASRWLLQQHQVAALISIGFAGGLGEGATRGKVVLATEIIDAATQTSYACDAALLGGGEDLRGPLVTVASVAGKRAEKIALRAQWKAVAADMEASAVAEAALHAGIPCAAVKAVTDGPEDELAIDFHRCLTDTGGLSSVKIVFEGLRGIAQFRSLCLLARNSRVAASSLGRVLAGTQSRI